MTQPTLLDDLPVRRPTKPGHVPASSVEAYQRRPRDQRIQDAVNAVERWPDSTSAELAHERTNHYWAGPSTDDKLYVRRGLSDALARGLVEHAGKRICTVAGTTAVTWKVKTR